MPGRTIASQKPTGTSRRAKTTAPTTRLITRARRTSRAFSREFFMLVLETIGHLFASTIWAFLKSFCRCNSIPLRDLWPPLRGRGRKSSPLCFLFALYLPDVLPVLYAPERVSLRGETETVCPALGLNVAPSTVLDVGCGNQIPIIEQRVTSDNATQSILLAFGSLVRGERFANNLPIL